MEIEVRLLASSQPAIEKRANGKEYITGRAIVFGQWSEVLGGMFQEMILRSAVDSADMTDIIVKFNHDINITLGRTSAGTAGYVISDEGVDYAVEYDPLDPDHVRVRRKIERGDCKGSSFEFSMPSDGGDDWVQDPGGMWKRTVSRMRRIHDFAPVINPAYPQTSTAFGKRSLNEYLESRGFMVDIKITEQPDTRQELVNLEVDLSSEEQETPSISAVPLDLYERKLKLMNAGI